MWHTALLNHVVAPARTGRGLLDRRAILTIVLTLGLVAAFAAVVLIRFHDQSWMPSDEGYYAHIAERMLGGEVLHRDVQALHGGYVYFAHALSFSIFGYDLVSLRYSFVVLAFLQVCLVFLLFLPRGAAVAAVAGVAMTALSFVQFISPNANWYCLFLMIAAVCVLAWVPRDKPWRLELLGFLIVTAFLVRQLNGVFIAMGVISYLLTQARSGAASRDLWLARGLVLIMAAGLGGYMAMKNDTFTWLIFGVWPLALLAWTWRAAEASNADVRRLVLKMLLGGAAALAPLFLYHLVNGSVAAWFNDTVVTAFSMTELAYVAKRKMYWLYAYVGLREVIRFDNPAAVLNGLYWLALTLSTPLLGVLVLRHLLRARDGNRPPLHPLPFLAVFYAVVAVHFQAPAYVYYGISPVVVGLLWLSGGAVPWRRHAAAAAVCAVAAVGLVQHAGQPVARYFVKFMAGQRIAYVPSRGLPRSSLWIEARDVEDHAAVLRLIERHSKPGDAILTIPGDPQFHFLSRRRNPLPYPFIAYGLFSDAKVAATLKVLTRDPPKLVVYGPKWGHNTPYTDRIMDFVRRNYEPIFTSHPLYKVYRYRGAAAPGPPARPAK